MSTQGTTLGPCPFCGGRITTHDVVIEYETADGDHGVWVDCPDCRDIVDPT